MNPEKRANHSTAEFKARVARLVEQQGLESHRQPPFEATIRANHAALFPRSGWNRRYQAREKAQQETFEYSASFIAARGVTQLSVI